MLIYYQLWVDQNGERALTTDCGEYTAVVPRNDRALFSIITLQSPLNQNDDFNCSRKTILLVAS